MWLFATQDWMKWLPQILVLLGVCFQKAEEKNMAASLKSTNVVLFFVLSALPVIGLIFISSKSWEAQRLQHRKSFVSSLTIIHLMSAQIYSKRGDSRWAMRGVNYTTREILNTPRLHNQVTELYRESTECAWILCLLRVIHWKHYTLYMTIIFVVTVFDCIILFKSLPRHSNMKVLSF